MAVTPEGSRPSTRICMRLGLVLQERLRGQHVLDLAGADAEGQRPERAVGGGVAVAADDRHARLGVAQLGPDHVDDALIGVVDVVEPDAELAAILPQRVDLLFRHRIDDRQAAVGGGHVVIDAWPRSARAAAPCGRPAAAPRTPGGWSLRGPGEDRCRGSSVSPARRGRRGRPRSSRTSCGEWDCWRSWEKDYRARRKRRERTTINYTASSGPPARATVGGSGNGG